MVAQLLVHSLFVVFLAQANPPLDEIVRTIGVDFGSSKKILLRNYPKTFSSPGFYGGYTPISDSYSGKKDRHQWVTTEHPARPSRNRMTAPVNDERRNFGAFLQLPSPSGVRKSAHASKILNVSRTEGHGKAGLIRILFSVCVGEFRGWSLIPRDPRLDVAGRNRLSGFVRILVAAVICGMGGDLVQDPIQRHLV